MQINPDDFTVRLELRKEDQTTVIKQWTFKGLFNAQAKSLFYFDSLIKRLKPEALSKPLMIQVLHNHKTLKEYKTESW